MCEVSIARYVKAGIAPRKCDVDAWIAAGGDLLFATHRDRALYLGRSVRDRPLWLKENPGTWRRIQSLQQEVPVQPLAESESNVGTIPARPNTVQLTIY
jgi:hypothetical protein